MSAPTPARDEFGDECAPMTATQLMAYAVRLGELRGSAIAMGDRAIRDMLLHSAGVVARIDAVVAELQPREGESATDHRRRIDAAIGELDSGATVFEGN